jgi:hypothetical protein
VNANAGRTWRRNHFCTSSFATSSDRYVSIGHLSPYKPSRREGGSFRESSIRGTRLVKVEAVDFLS